MRSEDFEALIELLKRDLLNGTINPSVAIVGRTPVALDLIAFLRGAGLQGRFVGLYDPSATTYEPTDPLSARPLSDLSADAPDIVVIASDSDKERLVEAAAPFLTPATRVLVGGFAHFAFRDAIFDEETNNTLVPSLANGYPNCLIHIYQCLASAARLKLDGAVVEFGMFRGGTTMLISRFIERLGQTWPVLGFDTFAGFPPRRSPLDMYAHPDCVFLDEPAARRYLSGRDVEIVSGDIVETAKHLEGQRVLLAFIDTDNYTSANAALDVVQDNVIPGGAIVFDHFTGQNRFLFTLGERIAAKRLLTDERFFNLHGTGVFLRVR